MSLDGARYFYVNPLASPGRPEVLGRGGHERREWYFVACCPPNVMRLIATLGQYLATTDESGVQIHQYAPATLSTTDAALRIETSYPWDGHVDIDVGRAPKQLRLRVPGMVHGADDQRSGRERNRNGYIAMQPSDGERIELSLPMPPRLTRAHPRVESCIGSVAIERGPLVYCLEQV